MRQLIFRKSYYNGLCQLSPEKRLEAYDAIMEYAFGEGDGKLPSEDLRPILTVILDSINLDFDRYEAKCGKEK